MDKSLGDCSHTMCEDNPKEIALGIHQLQLKAAHLGGGQIIFNRRYETEINIKSITLSIGEKKKGIFE